MESGQLDYIMEQKAFCSTCGNESDMEDKFCSKCGNSLLDIVQNENESDSSKVTELYNPEKQKAFFKDNGEIIVKRTEHRCAG
jgi:uncharacterized membrane protein YvbJ